MHGVGLEEDVRMWFDPRPGRQRGNGHKPSRRRAAHPVPRTTVPPDLIERSLS